MAQENSPIPSLIKGVEIPQEGARPKLDDVELSSSEMSDQLDAFYQCAGVVVERFEQINYFDGL